MKESTPIGGQKIIEQGVCKVAEILNPTDTLNSHTLYQKLSGVVANLELKERSEDLFFSPPLPFLLFLPLHSLLLPFLPLLFPPFPILPLLPSPLLPFLPSFLPPFP